MKTRIWNRYSKKGSGFLIVFAVFVLMAMLGLSLYRYKVFQRTLQLETSFRDSIQASYAAEYAFRHSLDFLEQGFREGRSQNTFNGLAVIPLSPSECRVGQGATPGCFHVSRSIDITAAQREENPSLPEHAAFFVKCEGNCGLTPSFLGSSRVTVRIAAFKDGSVETWEYVALVGKGSVFSPGVFQGGGAGSTSYLKPAYYKGVKRIPKAAIQDLKTQCSGGEAAYKEHLKQYFTTKVCADSAYELVKDASVQQKQVQVADKSSLQSAVELESQVLASTLNYKENLQQFSNEYYEELGYASAVAAEADLKEMDDETFIANVYEPKLASSLSFKSLRLKAKTTTTSGGGGSVLSGGGGAISTGPGGALGGGGAISGTGGSGEGSGSGGSTGGTGGVEPEFEVDDEAAGAGTTVFLDLNRSLSSVSSRNVQAKEVSYEVPDELAFSKVCAVDSKYPVYSDIQDEVETWIEEVKTTENPQVTKVDCGTSCEVEIDCVGGVHVVKMIKGDASEQDISITLKDAVVFSAQPLAIRKAYFCTSEEAEPVSIVSEKNVVIETPVVAKSRMNAADPSWTKEKMYQLSAETPSKLAFISKKDVVIDPTKMKSLELKSGDVLELSDDTVASIDISAGEDLWGGWIEADIAAREQVRMTGSLLSSKPVTIAGAVAAKSFESHVLTGDSSNTCQKVGSHVVFNPKPARPGKGPKGPPLGGAVDIEIIKIRRGNLDRDFAQGP